VVNVCDDGDVSYFHDDALPENADEWAYPLIFSGCKGTTIRRRGQMNVKD
jgi:hypothetical protein